jgi:hypothetical protein
MVGAGAAIAGADCAETHMKAFPGKKCSICKAAIPTGTDIHYDGETKTVQHWECFEREEPPSADQIALAERLGFVPDSDVERTSFVAICADWSMRVLRSGDRDRPAPAERSDNATRGLFNSVR